MNRDNHHTKSIGCHFYWIIIFKKIIFARTILWTWTSIFINKFLDFSFSNLRNLVQILEAHMWQIAPWACYWAGLLDFIDCTLWVTDWRSVTLVEPCMWEVDNIQPIGKEERSSNYHWSLSYIFDLWGKILECTTAIEWGTCNILSRKFHIVKTS